MEFMVQVMESILIRVATVDSDCNTWFAKLSM